MKNMKTTFAVYTDADVVHRIKEISTLTGAPIGDIHTLLLTRALDAANLDDLRAWAAQQVSRRGRGAGALRASEKNILFVLDDYPKKHFPVFRLPTSDVAQLAGIRPPQAYDDLHRLKLRGLVGVLDMNKGETDKWGRLTGLNWWVPEWAVKHAAYNRQQAEANEVFETGLFPHELAQQKADIARANAERQRELERGK